MSLNDQLDAVFGEDTMSERDTIETIIQELANDNNRVVTFTNTVFGFPVFYTEYRIVDGVIYTRLTHPYIGPSRWLTASELFGIDRNLQRLIEHVRDNDPYTFETRTETNGEQL